MCCINHRCTIEDQTRCQLVLPQCFIGQVIKGLHDDNGHLGFDRVMNLIRARFYWPRIAKDVKIKLQNCERCFRRKSSTTEHCASMVNMMSTYPMELVCMDYLTFGRVQGRLWKYLSGD